MRIDDKQQRKMLYISVLDKSSSMAGERWETATKGVEDIFTEIQSLEDLDFSFITFSSPGNSVLYEPMPIKEISLETLRMRFGQVGGNTALLDAIKKASVIANQFIQLNENAGVVVNVFTDGEENASQIGYGAIKNQIKIDENNDIMFTFQGPERGIELFRQRLEIASDKISKHTNTRGSIAQSMGSTRSASFNTISKMSAGASASSLEFYAQDS